MLLNYTQSKTLQKQNARKVYNLWKTILYIGKGVKLIKHQSLGLAYLEWNWKKLNSNWFQYGDIAIQHIVPGKQWLITYSTQIYTSNI